MKIGFAEQEYKKYIESVGKMNYFSRIFKMIKSVGLLEFLAGDMYCKKCSSWRDKRMINVGVKTYEENNKIKSDLKYMIICSKCGYHFENYNKTDIFIKTKTLKRKEREEIK